MLRLQSITAMQIRPASSRAFSSVKFSVRSASTSCGTTRAASAHAGA